MKPASLPCSPRRDQMEAEGAHIREPQRSTPHNADAPMIFGWRVRSRHPFPLLSRWNGQDTSSPITVVDGAVAIPDEAPLSRSGLVDLYADGRTLIHPADGPRILVDNRDQLIVESDGCADTHLHSWLFNVAITSICHLRGYPPLHGAAVGVGGQAVVLAGSSGHGKSTTCWAMLNRGHRLLSDDLSVVDTDTMMVRPAYPAVKLWAATAPDLLMNPAFQALPKKNKFFLPMPDRFESRPLPLSLVIALQKDPSITRPLVHHVPPPVAAAKLQRYVWGREVDLMLNGARTAFALTTAIARRVPVFVLRRPENLASLNDICETIETLCDKTTSGSL